MIIVQDTREKKPWDFTGYVECKGQIVKTIKAGDYIIYGKDNLITIDRKSRLTELANNLGMYYERFKREMERMQKYKFKYVLCEFTYGELLKFPKSAKLPPRIKNKIRTHGKFLAARILELAEEYGIQFVFCNGVEDAQRTAIKLFQMAINSEK